jgi:hypothetical protein
MSPRPPCPIHHCPLRILVTSDQSAAALEAARLIAAEIAPEGYTRIDARDDGLGRDASDALLYARAPTVLVRLASPRIPTYCWSFWRLIGVWVHDTQPHIEPGDPGWDAVLRVSDAGIDDIWVWRMANNREDLVAWLHARSARGSELRS